ncbi:hypothetical protein O59_000225 [Cellvibrio sp. BR]|nr:hypothetical protein O59_000225 [Cellvibrio sp. BR]
MPARQGCKPCRAQACGIKDNKFGQSLSAVVSLALAHLAPLPRCD